MLMAVVLDNINQYYLYGFHCRFFNRLYPSEEILVIFSCSWIIRLVNILGKYNLLARVSIFFLWKKSSNKMLQFFHFFENFERSFQSSVDTSLYLPVFTRRQKFVFKKLEETFYKLFYKFVLHPNYKIYCKNLTNGKNFYQSRECIKK